MLNREDEWERQPGDEWLDWTIDIDTVERHCHAPTMHDWLTPEDPRLLALVELALGFWDGDPVAARDGILARCAELRRPPTLH